MNTPETQSGGSLKPVGSEHRHEWQYSHRRGSPCWKRRCDCGLMQERNPGSRTDWGWITVRPPNAKVSDGSQPPVTLDSSLSETAGSRSLHRLVGLFSFFLDWGERHATIRRPQCAMIINIENLVMHVLGKLKSQTVLSELIASCEGPENRWRTALGKFRTYCLCDRPTS